MRTRSVIWASISTVLVAAPLTLPPSAHAAESWHHGWCAEDEGLSVVVDYGGIEDPSIPDTGWEARCLVGGQVDPGADTTRVAALKAVGLTVEASGSYVEGINGVNEFDHGMSWWMFSGATVPGTWDANNYDIAAGKNVAIGAKYVVDGDGNTPRPAPQFAEPTGPTAPTEPTVPAVSGATPTISGTLRVGTTLRATPGRWTAGTRLSYQWLRNGAAIKGATSNRYTITAADRGKRISVRVTGTLAGHTTTQLTSVGSAIAAGQLTGPRPRITGTPRQGRKLTVKVGAWRPKPVTLKYRWLRNGKPIKGATALRYRLTAKDRGNRISVKVTVTKAGWTTRSLTSARTKKITR